MRRPRWRRTCSTRLPTLRFGYASAVSIVFGLSLVVALPTSASCCAGTSKAPPRWEPGDAQYAPVGSARRSGSPARVLYLVAFVVLAVDHRPADLRGPRRLPRQRRSSPRDPVGLPTRGSWRTTRASSQTRSFWRQVAEQHADRAPDHRASCCPPRRWRRSCIARYTFQGRELVYGLFTLGLLFPVAVAILPAVHHAAPDSACSATRSASPCRRPRSGCRSRS